jgi:hypothetical protein
VLENIPKSYIFLDETGCVLNEKMMPDLTVMVLELEIDRKISKIHISKEKCTGTGVRVLTGGKGGIGGVFTGTETKQ